MGMNEMPIGVNDLLILSKNKKIIIYGYGKSGGSTLSYLYHLGLKCAYIVDKNYMSFCNDSGIGIPVKSPYDLLYENRDEVFILLCIKYADEPKKILNDMGFIENKHYIYFAARRSKRMTHLSPYLGWCRGEKSIISYGNNNAEKILLTLGGSTTDDLMDGLTSWPQVLQDMLGLEHWCVKNGGGASYASSQELIQLVYNGLNFEGRIPDVVISYTGVNDGLKLSTKQYVHFSAMEAFDRYNNGVTEMYYGNNLSDATSLFMANIRMMHAICEEFGIVYICFLQPTLVLCDSLEDYDKKIYLNGPYKESTQITREFYETVRRWAVGIDYIVDCSNMLQERPDVYLDNCHLKQEGNYLVAKEILDSLIKRGVL